MGDSSPSSEWHLGCPSTGGFGTQHGRSGALSHQAAIFAASRPGQLLPWCGMRGSRSMSVSLHAQDYQDLVLVREDLTPAPCQIHLFSKDGVYMLQIPRLVPDIVLSAANRCRACSSSECSYTLG